MNMTNAELKELVASLAIAQRETERLFRESKLETERQLRESKQESERQLRKSRLEVDQQFKETERQLLESKLETERQLRESKLEVDQRFKETERQLLESKLETERQLRESKLEVDQQFKETERQLRKSKLEVDQQFKETERQLLESKLETERQLRESKQETERQLCESRLEVDRRFKETERLLRQSSLEVDRQLKELRIEIGGIGNKFGSFTEGMALPAIEKILHDEFGLERFHPNAKSMKDDRTLELDMLGYSNGINNKVVIVEVKSHLRLRDIKQVLKILQEFPEFFPEHADKKLYGMIAAVAVSKETRQQVIESGLYLGRIHDEQFKLTVPANFTPRCFNRIS